MMRNQLVSFVLLFGAWNSFNSFSAAYATCPTHWFSCGNSGVCIPRQHVCDYHSDCPNGEDEDQSCQPPWCGLGQFECASNYTGNQNHCLPKRHRCDGQADCSDASDENGCHYVNCSESSFKCDSGQCITSDLKCDGKWDCRDKSDEKDCNHSACNPDEFRCLNDECISIELECDQHQDCANASDEFFCKSIPQSGSIVPCEDLDAFVCDNGWCISRMKKCDGSDHCGDFSDEKNCELSCGENQFGCADGSKCINEEYVCDATVNCADGSDETSQCSTALCETIQCEHMCKPSMQGGICTCPLGHYLADDNRMCEDLNECEGRGFCDQLCTNTPGSYSCSCVDGYHLDGSSCVANNSSQMRLIYTDQQLIHRLDTSGVVSAEILLNTTMSSGIAYHYQKGLLFWTDTTSRKVFVGDLNDSSGTAFRELSVNSTYWLPVALDVDWISNNVYVLDQRGEKVDVFDLEGKNHYIVLDRNLTKPNDFTLDPTKGYMFIADQRKILRANMDGNNLITLVSDRILYSSGITIDIVSSLVFFCDPHLHLIEVVDYNGNNRITVVGGVTNVHSPSRLTLFERTIFWTSTKRRGVFRVDEFNGADSIVSVYQYPDTSAKIGKPLAIKAVHPVLQPVVSGPCYESLCEHLCLSTANYDASSLAYRCACRVGFQLQSDGFRCQKVDSFLIYTCNNYIGNFALFNSTEKPAHYADLEKTTNRVDLYYGMEPLHAPYRKIVGLDFDARKNKLYYSDTNSKEVCSVNIDGSSHRCFVVESFTVSTLALDWVTNNLYYLTTSDNYLGVVNTNNTSFHRKILKDLSLPRGLVVHPNEGLVFISEWKRPARITRLASDGSQLFILSNLFLSWPNGLTIDYEMRRLYWCDARSNLVGHTRFDGSDTKEIAVGAIPHPFSLAVDSDFIYVADWRLGIIRLNKTNSSNPVTMLVPDDKQQLFAVTLFSQKHQQIRSDHPCKDENGGCEQFCFAVNNGNIVESDISSDGPNFVGTLRAQCGCSDGFQLLADSRRCERSAVAVETPSRPKCIDDELFGCRNGNCISKRWLCDGDDDCGDNSDETANCSFTGCDPGSRICPGTQRCVFEAFFCDGLNDCPNGGDERNCSTNSSSTNSSNSSCHDDEFKCASDECFPISWQCDDEDDCLDGSDELNCPAIPPHACSGEDFRCNNSKCIPLPWLCDDEDDCGDNSDESDCTTIECEPSQFRCASGKVCYPKSFQCDGQEDCVDGSDELHCTDNSTTHCLASTQFKCESTDECISIDLYCNGVMNCYDNSDEPDSCHQNLCQPGFYQCENKECIFVDLVCDGKKDCDDGSDEGYQHACSKQYLECLSSEWQCPGSQGHCIPRAAVCNGSSECPNGLDEGGSCNMSQCDLLADTLCSGMAGCLQTAQGPECLCGEGERLANNLSPSSAAGPAGGSDGGGGGGDEVSPYCVGIDECRIAGRCSQLCHDTKHGYRCSCGQEYRLDADKHTCKPINGTKPKLLVARKDTIAFTILGVQSHIELLPVGPSNAVALAANMYTGTLYWSDMKTKKIMRWKGNGLPTEMITSGINLVESLTLDWLTDNLYWVDSYLNTIEVTDVNGMYRKILINEQVDRPRGLALDPTPDARLMFWSDWGKNPRIVRTGLDGSKRLVIVSSKIRWPNGLAVDLPVKRLYFVDSNLDYIDFCHYDGSGRQQVLAKSNYLLHPHSIAVFGDTVYWSDRSFNGLLSAHKFAGRNQTLINKSMSQPRNILIVHAALQPRRDGDNPCQRGLCQQLCLLSPRPAGFVCACGVGYRLSQDGRSCVDAEQQFLMLLYGDRLQAVSLKTGANMPSAMIPVIGVSKATSIAYDRQTEKLFWVVDEDVENMLFQTFITNYKAEKKSVIYTRSLLGGNTTLLLTNDMVGSPTAVAFDWLARNMYVAVQQPGSIWLISLGDDTGHAAPAAGGQYRRKLLASTMNDTGVSAPVDLTLLSMRGYLVWADEGGAGVPVKIGLVRMDGTGAKVLARVDGRPLSVAADLATDTIYWSCQDPALVQSISISGGEIKTLLDAGSGIAQPRSIYCHQSYLYMIDSLYESVSRVSLPGGDENLVLRNNTEDLKQLAVFHSIPEGFSHPCMEDNGGCAHLCVPSSASERRCLCSVGFEATGVTGCQEHTSFLIVVQLKMARGYELEHNHEAMTPIVGSDSSLLHMDVDVHDKFIYWVEHSVFDNKVYRIRPNGSEKETVLENGIGLIGIKGLAVDWLSENIYIINAFRFETYIEVCRSNGDHCLVLMKTVKSSPSNLVVNPIKRYLYWVDNGQNSKIVRSLLNGQNLDILVTRGLNKPLALTIDIQSHDVYFSDVGLDTIVKMDYDGANRQVIRLRVPNVVGLAVHRDSLYWADQNLAQVLRVSLLPNNASKRVSMIRTGVSDLRGLLFFDQSTQPRPHLSDPGSNPCLPGHSPCQQLCLALAVNTTAIREAASAAPADYQCACAVGVLADDKVGCRHGDDFILLTTHSKVLSIGLDSDTVAMPRPPIDNFTQMGDIAVAVADKKLLFVQKSSIKWMSLDSTPENATTIISSASSSIVPSVIEYDWIGKKVYWMDRLSASIYAVNMDGSHQVPLTTSQRPGVLAIDPCRGLMYFVDWVSDPDTDDLSTTLWGRSSAIYQSTMAGSLKRPIITGHLSKLSSLALDRAEQKLYWYDSRKQHIERADVTGSNREVVISAVIYLYDLAVSGDIIYWTSLSSQGIFRAEKHTGERLEGLRNKMSEFSIYIGIFSADEQQCDPPFDPCNIQNGGCDQSCHPSINGTAECKCNSTLKLANDNKMCVSVDANCSANSFTCHNGKCIAETWACDGTDDCGDASDEMDRFCAHHNCETGKFRCTNGRCIYNSWTCDFENDCGDGSDELGCNYTQCADNEFTCANKKCISNESLCDGVNNCRDDGPSDESLELCSVHNRTCPDHTFRCRNSTVCLDRQWLCDDDDDCGDNSDEELITCQNRECRTNSFRCSNYKCINLQWVCDGDKDCDDGSDEPSNCSRKAFLCSDIHNKFLCDNEECVNKDYVCDGDNDCGDNSDEDARHQCENRGCGVGKFECSPTPYLVTQKRCIPNAWFCDGDVDCPDGSDEDATNANCTKKIDQCDADEFSCKNGRCISKHKVCDHDDDCYDGSDEGRECNDRYRNCTEDEFACNNSKCITRRFQCDKENDCGDNSDEMNCDVGNKTCSVGMFDCGDSDNTCIEYRLVCNKESDCPNGADETARCNVNECDRPQVNRCAQKCVNTLTSYHCDCDPGYKLMADGRACADLDECTELPAQCSQRCHNRPGGFDCKCDERYFHRRDDGHTCKRRSGGAGWLLFTNKHYLRNISTDGSASTLVKHNLENAVGMDYHWQLGYVFVADVELKKISRYHIDDFVERPVVVRDADGLEGISVDWVANKLYWLSIKNKLLQVSQLDGSHRRTIMTKGVSDPRSLAVHPGIGYAYLTDWGLHACIGRVGLDGSNFKRLLTYKDKIVWPNALTIDYLAERIYWADAHLDYIAYARLDGSGRHQLMSGANVRHVFSLSVLDDTLYWSDWHEMAVLRGDKLSGGAVRALQRLLHRPLDVKTWHWSRQLNYTNPCAGARCSHLCLLAPGNASAAGEPGATRAQCACPDNFVLTADGRTCMANCSDRFHRCGPPDDVCLPWTSKCDGQKDCQDGSDEHNCPERKCELGQFQCANQQCKQLTVVCNGVDNCGDNSDEQHCAAECGEHETRCQSTGRCITNKWLCDGDVDCTDGSDEAPSVCHHGQCDQETQFNCSNGKCIPKLWSCDGDNDCGDDSDEPAHWCRQQSCPDGWLRCPSWGNYRCIPNWLFCDGKDDCRDGSDEKPENCPKCLDSEFQCDNKRCVPQRWLCDNNNDCLDNSDESAAQCESRYRNCSESEFHCDNAKCVRQKWRCDTDNDCGDNSDEQNCQNFPCPSDKFQCASGHCISAEHRCDDRRDCDDLSDELNCPPRFANGSYCSYTSYECDNHLCVSRNSICDGYDNCGDRSDEHNCFERACGLTNHFRCDNGNCIHHLMTCDGKDDCGDASDENNFTRCSDIVEHCSWYGNFKCSDGSCLPTSKMCDHNADCQDKSDEIGCYTANGTAFPGKLCRDNRGGCSQLCSELSDHSGYVCHCESGYRVAVDNTKHCDDIDECAELKHTCSHTCTNLKGTFACGCRDGFEKDGETGVCRSLTDPLIVFAAGPEIQAFNVTDGSTSYMLRQQSHIECLDMNPTTSMMYWTDSVDRSIKRSYTPFVKPGSFMGYAQELPIKRAAKPTAIAVDWTSGNIYWSEVNGSSSTPHGTVLVATADGRYRRALVATELEMPLSIALDPEHGVMFWNDVGSRPKIESSWMDGTERKVIVETNLVYPVALTVDHSQSRHVLYWLDPGRQLLEAAFEDGSQRRHVLQLKSQRQLVSLDVFESMLYWVSEEGGNIYRQDKFGRGLPVRVLGDLAGAASVRVLHRQRYNASVANRCLNQNCSHLCLIIPGSFQCACPDGSRKSDQSGFTCDAPLEAELPPPLLCGCRNGGVCRQSGSRRLDQPVCECPDQYGGTYCEKLHAQRVIVQPDQTATSNVTSVVVSLVLIVLIISAVVVFLLLRRNPRLKSMVWSFPGSGRVSFHNSSSITFDADNESVCGGGGGGVSLGGDNGKLSVTNPLYEEEVNQNTSSNGVEPNSPVGKSAGDLSNGKTAAASYNVFSPSTAKQCDSDKQQLVVSDDEGEMDC